MTIVADATVAVRWAIDTTGSDRARDVLRQDRIIAPDLVMAELANAVWKSIVFGGLPEAPLTAAVAGAEKAFDELVPTTKLKGRALSIAIALKHPVYDCFYLALAEERECMLATFDERLVRRCAETVYSGLLRPL